MSGRTTTGPEEMPPEASSTLGHWTRLVAGPALFMTYFGLVYLAAEASCRAEHVEGFAFFGPGVLRAMILVATVVTVVIVLAVAAGCARDARRTGSGADPVFARAGAILGLGSAFAVLALGLPVLVIGPC